MLRTAAVLSVLAAAAVVASASSAGSDGTVVHRFHPFVQGRFTSGVHIEETRRGYCWTTSAVESRRYTWRCLRGNLIHDPCFSATRHSRFVLCPIRPWSNQVVRLKLSRALPPWQHRVANPGLPVGVWTATGKRCSHSSGATSEIRGKPITYACVGGGVLAAFANRSSPTWTIWYAPSYKAHRLSRVDITDAWW